MGGSNQLKRLPLVLTPAPTLIARPLTQADTSAKAFERATPRAEVFSKRYLPRRISIFLLSKIVRGGREGGREGEREGGRRGERGGVVRGGMERREGGW